MADFLGCAQIAAGEQFQQRVQFALSVAAANVYTESSGIAGHVARAAFAVKVANGSANIPAAALVIIGNSTISAEAVTAVSQNSIPDSDIQFAVNSNWNLLAGA